MSFIQKGVGSIDNDVALDDEGGWGEGQSSPGTLIDLRCALVSTLLDIVKQEVMCLSPPLTSENSKSY